MRCVAGVLLLATISLASMTAGAEGIVRYVVEGDGIPAPLTAAPGDPSRGRLIVVNRQVGACLLCHAGPFPEERFQGSVAPDLRGVGARLSAAQIRLRVVDPAALNAATVMPSYHVASGFSRVARAWQGKPALSADQIEDVVALLATLREPIP